MTDQTNGTTAGWAQDATGRQRSLQTLIAYVENKPGVLNRVTSLFRRRSYNIDSLAVGRTEDPTVSRMTIVTEADDQTARLIEANLYKLVNVLRVENVTFQPTVERDLALIKVEADAEARTKVLQICDVFRARAVDVSPNAVIVEITGAEDKLQGLVDILRPFNIIEMVRTGTVSILRGEQALTAHPQFVKAIVPTNGSSQ